MAIEFYDKPCILCGGRTKRNGNVIVCQACGGSFSVVSDEKEMNQGAKPENNIFPQGQSEDRTKGGSSFHLVGSEHEYRVYVEATEILENATCIEDYELASEWFDSISGYMDADELSLKARRECDVFEKYKNAVDILYRSNSIDEIERNAETFLELDEFKDSKSLYQQSLDKIENLKKESIYQDALLLASAKKSKKAVAKFKSISGYKDSDKKIREFNERKRRKTVTRIVVTFVIFAVAVAIFIGMIQIPQIRYGFALKLADIELYESAESLLDNNDSDEGRVRYYQLNFIRAIDMIEKKNNEGVLELFPSNNVEITIVEFDSYDECGNCARKTITYPDGSVDNIEYTYEYDSNENMVSRVAEIETVSNIRKTEKTVYQYDISGNLIKETVYYSSNITETIEYGYNSNGECTLKTMYTNAADADKETWKYEYDSNGNCIREIHSGIANLYSHEFGLNQKCTYLHERICNASWYYTSTGEYSHSGYQYYGPIQVTQTVFRYNILGNVEDKYYRVYEKGAAYRENDPCYEKYIDYIYDANGNCVKEIQIEVNIDLTEN